MEDSRIVDLYLARDEQAIALSQQEYGAQLRRVSQRILSDPGEAEECENDSYFAAWKQIPPHRPYGYLLAFLTKIIRALSIDRLRRNTRQKRSARVVELTDELAQCLTDGSTPEDAVNREELGMLISEFLRKQKPLERRLFIRRYWLCESIQEVADFYRLNRNTVKTKLFRLRTQLKKELEQEGYL